MQIEAIKNELLDDDLYCQLNYTMKLSDLLTRYDIKDGDNVIITDNIARDFTIKTAKKAYLQNRYINEITYDNDTLIITLCSDDIMNY